MTTFFIFLFFRFLKNSMLPKKKKKQNKTVGVFFCSLRKTPYQQFWPQRCIPPYVCAMSMVKPVSVFKKT